MKITIAEFIELWQWYAAHQTELCPVDGHDVLCAHTVMELIECARKKGIITFKEGKEIGEKENSLS